MKRLFFFFLIVVGGTAALWAQQLNETWGFDGEVATIKPDGNYIYVGGRLSYYGPLTGSGAVVSEDDVTPSKNFPFVNGLISACASDGNGGWYIGGGFTKVGNYQRKGLAHINADGTVSAWDPQPDDAIEKIVPVGNYVYVCGYFKMIGGAERHYLAKLNNTDGAAVPGWDPEPDWVVHDIAPAGKYIFVGGEFRSIGHAPHHHSFIAKLKASDGTVVDSFFPLPDSFVRTIVLHYGSLYVGGDFISFWGVGPWYYAAKIDTSKGEPISPFWNPHPNHRVTNIAIDGDRVFLAGEFSQVGIDTVVNRHFIAEVESSEGKPSLLWSPDADNFIENIKVHNGKLYVVGQFKKIGGENINYVARLDERWGFPDHSWIPDADGTIRDIAFSGNKIFIGGHCRSIGGISVNNLVRLNKNDFSLDTTWLPNVDNPVNKIVTDDQNVFIAGDFNYVNNSYLPQLAKLNKTNGNPDPNWVPMPDRTVDCMLSLSDTLVIGGSFRKVGASARDRIAMVNKSNGKVLNWAPYISGGLQYGHIRSMDVKDGYIYAAGRFYNADRSAITNYLRRISIKNAKEDPNWNPQTDYMVNSIHINGNDIFLAGEFNYVNGMPIEHVAKLDVATGAVDQNWQPMPDASVETVTSDNDYVYIGGFFQNVGNHPIQYFARLDYNTAAVDQQWDLRLSTASPIYNADVSTIALSKDLVLLGGVFDYLGETPVSNFAVLKDALYSLRFPSPPSDIEIIPYNASVLLKWREAVQTNVANFNIYISTDTTKGYNLYTTVNAPDTLVWVKNLKNGTKYFFKITAVNSHGDESEASGTVATVPNIVPRGLVAFYPFTNGSGADSSGNNQNGILHNVTGVKDRFGRENSAFYFNGTNSYIDCGNNSSFQADSQLTVTGWMFVKDSTGNIQYLLSDFGIMSGYALYLSNNKLNLILNQTLIDSVSFPLNQWVFFAITFHKGIESFYINGALSEQQNGMTIYKIKPSTHNLYIGHTDFAGNDKNYFKGILDDIRIYNRGLALWEINEIMNASGWTHVVPEPPQKFMCAMRNKDEITFSWTRGVPDVSHYNIYMINTVDSTLKYLDSIFPPDTNYTVEIDNRPSQSANFTVTTVDNMGRESCFSDTVVISPQTALDAPTPVYPLQHTSLGDTLRTIMFQWNPINQADHYRLQIAKDAQFQSMILDTLSNANTSTIAISLPVPLKPFYWRVRGISSCSQGPWSETIHVSPVVTSVEESQIVPKKFFLSQNYPNPFGAASDGGHRITIIKYGIPLVGTDGNQPVSLEVYDVLGRKVVSLVNQKQSPGTYSVRLNASALSPGIYFYKFKCGHFVKVKKMILLQ